MIDRKTYLEMCQRCAVLEEDYFAVKINVPDKDKVVYNGDVYYPCGYLLSFDNDGSVRHTAILHDLKCNSITMAALGRVEEYKNE